MHPIFPMISREDQEDNKKDPSLTAVLAFPSSIERASSKLPKGQKMLLH